ncbi:MAG TPA: hypothetical protein VGL57_11810 [Solirubrobacteraceae bacterium]|jgi:Rod binding domain-containing protein
MSSPLAISSAAVAGLPVASQTRAPAAVRDGSPAVKQAYTTAQGFEEMLLQQLSQTLVQSSGLSGESEGEGEGGEGSGSSSSESGGGILASLMPQTLTEGVMRQGGIGLATQLMSELDPAAGAGKSAASAVGAAGGVAATTSPAATGTETANTAGQTLAGPTGGASA